MKKDVNICIKGVYMAEEERTTTELYTVGSLCKKNGHFYLTYAESETTGFEGCVTTMKLEEDRVTVIRRGPATAHLILQKGIRNVGRYEMMGTLMDIGVYTDGMESTMTEDGGSLHLKYTMDMNSALLSENELDISVTQI
ncbi:MAG TPA: DUF1934 domain-containing protein [Candidatus Merdivicinus excrementipullorum]|uniref:DUF1934 domain-containing protein n=1 Tax=Candidatus Merdivicinus excrementipullorum TaxID=2840867 RepID=A0A9D1FN10_9FIRM|nr:DUF1934 domain-containing protein [Candidatus Merdivicinus excrementipullorum]